MLWQTKGSKTQSLVVSEHLQNEIREYFKEFPYLTKDRDDYLFRSQKGKGFSSQTIQGLFRQLYRDANIDNASSHSGRRQFISTVNLSIPKMFAFPVTQLYPYYNWYTLGALFHGNFY